MKTILKKRNNVYKTPVLYTEEKNISGYKNITNYISVYYFNDITKDDCLDIANKLVSYIEEDKKEKKYFKELKKLKEIIDFFKEEERISKNYAKKGRTIKDIMATGEATAKEVIAHIFDKRNIPWTIKGLAKYQLDLKLDLATGGWDKQPLTGGKVFIDYEELNDFVKFDEKEYKKLKNFFGFKLKKNEEYCAIMYYISSTKKTKVLLIQIRGKGEYSNNKLYGFVEQLPSLDDWTGSSNTTEEKIRMSGIVREEDLLEVIED